MVSPRTEDRAKQRNDRAKRAIALAMQNRWSEAMAANLSILRGFPEDMVACNRLGKALSELGRVREAKAAFRRALEISSHNTIAKKNLDRLCQLDDTAPRGNAMSSKAAHAFIEESGKTGVTWLINLVSRKVLLKMSPGHPVRLQMAGGRLIVENSSGEYLGEVEPKLASRLTRLTRGGNRYEATVTSVGERGLSVIIREVHKHPSQSATVSFPSRVGSGIRVYLPGGILGYGDDGADEPGRAPVVKDWSDDDTEPGDDDAFGPVVHRIIEAGSERLDQGEY